MAAPRIEVIVDGVAHRLVGAGPHMIGRDPGSDVVVDDPRVSRHHLLVEWAGTSWRVLDRGSAGGTFVDGAATGEVHVDGPLRLHLAAPDGPALDLRLLATIGDEAPTQQPLPPVVPPADAGRATGTVLTAVRPIRIGRDDDNDVVIRDLLVSRHHAELRPMDDGLELVDLDSHNDTYVNGRRVSATRVEEQDLVSIGHRQYRLVDGSLVEYADTGSITFAAEHLESEIGGHRLVDDVSFELRERSMLVIVGPSGAGKSSLLKLLSGARRPTGGAVLYEGRDLHHDLDELRHRIGFVPQADLLHDGLTVTQSLDFAGRLRFAGDVTAAERAERIAEVLDSLSLSHRADSRIDQLSGGERKRVNVATELLTQPSLILLDEPAAGLDAGLERQLMLELRELADAGHTIVVVTHSLDSLHLCEQVLVLARGGVPAFAGPPTAAPAYFDREDMVEIFHLLGREPERDWRFRTGSSPGAPAPSTAPPPPAGNDATPGVRRQFAALTRRFVAVLASDRRNLGLLVAQAPILGVLMLVALPAQELAPPNPTEIRFVSTAGLVLFVLLLGATWLGANNAIREIARERDLFHREKVVGQSTAAFVGSKAVVLGVLTALQCTVMVLIATARQGGPTDAVVLGWPMGELIVVVSLAGIASMALALLVSAVVGTPDRATTILPVVLILQFVLSAGGVLPEIVDRPGLRELSNLASAQWGFAGAASTAELNELQAFTDQLRDLRVVDATDPQQAIDALEEPAVPEARWEHDAGAWFTSAGALVGLTVVPLVGAVVVLRRREEP